MLRGTGAGPTVPVCPWCGEVGVHRNADACLDKLHRLVEGERMAAVTWLRTPDDGDLLTFVALLLDLFEGRQRRPPQRPWTFSDTREPRGSPG